MSTKVIEIKRAGPCATDESDDIGMSEPIVKCTGCRFLGIHDGHYFYCAMQYAQNCDPAYSSPYPWRGAGKHMARGPYPDECPIASISDRAALLAMYEIAQEERFAGLPDELKQLVEWAVFTASEGTTRRQQIKDKAQAEKMAQIEAKFKILQDAISAVYAITH